MTSKPYRLFAITLPGLEPFARQELDALGLLPSAQEAAAPAEGEAPALEAVGDTGGVEFDGDLKEIYRANLHLRTVNRILVRMGEFEAQSFADLRKRASRLKWEQFMRPGQAVAFRVTCHKSRLYHSDAVAERVAGAIGDRLGQPVKVEKFDEEIQPLPQMVMVRLVHDQCMISLDTSGALLHRRGYRLETAKAPLRETLAAGLLAASGWDGASALMDPFCGSGTIPIEAALIARRIAPGKNRRFAFMDWPCFNPGVWRVQLAEAAAQELKSCGPIVASDRDAGAIRIATANAERAGVLEDIRLTCCAFSAVLPPAGPGWVVTNPPYGVRVSPARDLRDLYAHLGDVLRTLCPGWQVGMLCSTDFLAGHTRLRFEHNLPLSNGGIAVKFFTGPVR
jgi:putative N6-adenine-specific DNA methylase